MRRAYDYEEYLIDVGDYYLGDINCPNWYKNEREVIWWFNELHSELTDVICTSCISKRLLTRMKDIKTHRIAKLKNISPELKEIFNVHQEEIFNLYVDLSSNDYYWRYSHQLSDKGYERFSQAARIMNRSLHVYPDLSWRTDFIREYLSDEEFEKWIRAIEGMAEKYKERCGKYIINSNGKETLSEDATAYEYERFDRYKKLRSELVRIRGE